MNKKVIIVLIIIYLIMSTLNFLTPLYFGDDLVYAFIWPNQYINIPLPETVERVNSLKDILVSQWRHYYTNNGRAIAHFFVQFFVWQGKWLFNLVNPLVFLLLILQIQWIADKGKISFYNLRASSICWIFFILWTFVADFWCVYLWLAGACNYLWSIVILLFFLIPYESKYFDGDSYIFRTKKSNLSFFFLGICAGWGNENTICWIILILLYWFYNLFKLKQIENWMVCGFIGFCSGFVLSIFAPGNAVRTKYYLENYFMNSWLTVYSTELLKARLQNFVTIVFLQILLWYYILNSIWRLKSATFNNEANDKNIKKHYTLIILCCVFSILFNGIMLLSPDFPLRSGFASLVFITIAASLAMRVQHFTGRYFTTTYTKFLTLIGSTVFIMTLFGRFFDSFQFYEYDLSIKRMVQHHKQIHAETILTIPEYEQVSNVQNWISDLPLLQLNLSNNENNWRNVAFSRYYDIKGVRVVKKGKE